MSGDVTPLSSKVSGYITRVWVEDDQGVKLGDPIVEIDPSDYQAQFELASANRLQPRPPRRRSRSGGKRSGH
jgi:membrane fusion protein (multidrug efflux system)